MLLIDTHVLVWLDEGSERLGPKALNEIDTAFQNSQLAVSTISFWEVAMLVVKQRLNMRVDLDSWRRDLIQRGLKEIPLSGDIAILAGTLERFHGDPADRIISATALRTTAPLVTADRKIIDWPRLQTIDATL